MAIDDAQQTAGSYFELEVAGTQTNPQPEGTILFQDPAPGQQAPEGSAISVVTSSGPPSFDDSGGGGGPVDSGGQDRVEAGGEAASGVPDVSGMDIGQATGVLLSEGYTIEPSTETEPGSEPPGTVIGTDPPAGTQAPRGTAPRLIVSGGPSGSGG